MPGPLLQGYQFNQKAQRYVRQGRFVARSKIMGLLNTSIAARTERIAAGTTALAEGRISPSVYIARTTTLLKRQYLQNAALGAGGWDRLTQADYGRIGGTLKGELPRMAEMARQLQAGGISLAQAMNRVNMYEGHARSIFYTTEESRMPAPEPGNVWLERRILGPAEHCISCLTFAAMSWQPLGVLPVPGDASECNGNCRCSKERKQVPVSEGPEWQGRASRGGEIIFNKIMGPAEVGEWDPSQPRDASGRWGAGGASGGRTRGREEKAVDFAKDEPTRGAREWEKDQLKGHWIEDRGFDRANEKESVAFLRDHAGLTEQEASTMMYTWASSSGDHNITALTMQRKAAEVMGIKAPDFINERIANLEKNGETSRISEERIGAGLKAMYDRTQAEFRRQGIGPDDTIELYRGITLPKSLVGSVNRGDTFEWRTPSPLESYTTDQPTAKIFASMTTHPRQRKGTIEVMALTIRAHVPSRNIFSYFGTGLGTTHQAEHVVIGVPRTVLVDSAISAWEAR